MNDQHHTLPHQEVDSAELLPWILKKYHHHIPTLKLLESTSDPHERELILIVALLDVEDSLIHSIIEKVPAQDRYLLEQRNRTKELLHTQQLS